MFLMRLWGLPLTTHGEAEDELKQFVEVVGGPIEELC